MKLYVVLLVHGVTPSYGSPGGVLGVFADREEAEKDALEHMTEDRTGYSRGDRCFLHEMEVVEVEP